MKYVVLLRGINAGKQRRVAMPELKVQLADIGCREIETYLATGNIVCQSEWSRGELRAALTAMFRRHYDFVIDFSLITADEYRQQAAQLPSWWYESVARKDVAFFIDGTDRRLVAQSVKGGRFGDGELVYMGDLGIFFASRSAAAYKEVQYARWLGKQPYYGSVTVRTGNTFDAVLRMVQMNASRE